MGVSLIAAASPISRPRGHRGFFVTTSTVTKAIRTMLICPKLMVSRTGSSCSATATAMAVAVHEARVSNCGHTRPSTSRSVTASAAMDTKVNAILPNPRGSTVSGTKSIADSGG